MRLIERLVLLGIAAIVIVMIIMSFGVYSVYFAVKPVTFATPATKLDVLDTTKFPEETTLGRNTTYIPLNIEDNYARYASDIDRRYDAFIRSHPDLHVTRMWVHFVDRAPERSPMIYGIHIYHEVCSAPGSIPTRTLPTTLTQPTATALAQ